MIELEPTIFSFCPYLDIGKRRATNYATRPAPENEGIFIILLNICGFENMVFY